MEGNITLTTPEQRLLIHALNKISYGLKDEDQCDYQSTRKKIIELYNK